MIVDKLKIGQLILIIKKPNRATEVEIGDIATECGYTKGEPFGGQFQFHSQILVNTRRERENYWVEFLERDCYQLFTDEEIKRFQKCLLKNF